MQIVLKHVLIYYFTSVEEYYFFKNHIELSVYLFNEIAIRTNNFIENRYRLIEILSLIT